MAPLISQVSDQKTADIVIEAKNLVKMFSKQIPSGNKIRDFVFPQLVPFKAINNVSLSIHDKEIFGLLGPNGAGKTTLIRLLTGLLVPNKGSVKICGEPIFKSLKKIGVMFNFSMIYHRLTGYDNLKFFAKLYGVKNYKQRIKELADFLELGSWINNYVEHYSSGMKSKLALARALIHDPEILFLDEPTLGLDPKISLDIREQIKDMDKTILLTTHYMEEANQLCDRIGIINKGKMIRVDTPENLKKLIAKNIVVKIGLTHVENEILYQLKKETYIHSIELVEGGIKVLLEHKKYLSELLEFFSNYKITTISEEKPTLVDVFVRLTTDEKVKG